MAHTVKKDPMVPVLFLIGLGLLGGAVFVLVTNLYTTVVRNSVKGVEDNSLQVAVVAESLKPIGSVVTTADEPVAEAPASTGSADGEAIYNATCKACHATGVAGAPLFGDKAKWEPRVATGLDAMMKTAINGKGAMPPKGGNTALSDDELKASVLYMTKAAGFDLGSDTAKKEEPAKEAPVAEKKVEPAAPAKTEPAKEAPVVEKKAEPVAAPAKTEPAKEAPVVEKKAEPVAAPTKTEPAKEEPVAPAQPEPVAEPKKPAIPATPDAPEAPAPKTDAAAGAAASVPAKEEKPTPAEKSSGADLKKGEAIYNSACFACHKTGVAGAPLFGDKKLWAPRIATGMDAMLGSVIKGKGAMPPKAGTSLSDDELKNAVAYMVSKAQ
ncbi:MAG: c-type cytochrome [Sulfurovaceae bacterium]|nr:c-type cytochrome [Sulfurovaceae bacterium]